MGSWVGGWLGGRAALCMVVTCDMCCLCIFSDAVTYDMFACGDTCL